MTTSSLNYHVRLEPSLMKGSMPRSLRVQQDYIDKVKLALSRNGFPSQRSLAEDVGFALATVSNFLTGKPVDYTTFEELCRKLDLDWREVSTLVSAVGSPQVILPDSIDDVAIVLPVATKGSANRLNLEISPRYPNGAVPLGSPFYLERTPFEAQIDREIRKPGALIRIKAPREMGKTSLLLRVLDSAQGLGYQTVSLNLAQVDEAILSDLNQFLRCICANVARQLQLKPMLDEYWDEDLGSKISCTDYFQHYLLEKISTPLVLVFDEMNHIFEHPQIAKDFLPLLRSWYEEAKILPIWQKLRLIVVHSTEIYIPLQINQSPFNVGLPIQLDTFSPIEVQQLARRYGIDWEGSAEATQLIELVGGHPALVNIAFYHLSCGDITLSQLLETAPTATGIYHNHLQRHWVTLEAQPELLLALNGVMNATEPVSLELIIAYKLGSMGLIKQSQNNAVPNCELYRQFFLENKSHD
jgi:transcriptional regulator with XRE-family HTH domain